MAFVRLSDHERRQYAVNNKLPDIFEVIYQLDKDFIHIVLKTHIMKYILHLATRR